MFAEKYYHFLIPHVILMKFQVNIAQFNSSIMTHFYPNRAHNENITLYKATPLHRTGP